MFDTALIESAAPHGGIHSRAAGTLTLALGFHAAVIASLVVSALASTAEPSEPVIPIAFPVFRGGSPPPPAGGPSPIKASLVPRVRVDAPPVRIPDLPLPTGGEKSREGESAVGEQIVGTPGDGPEGEGGPGIPGGVPGGVPGGPGGPEEGGPEDSEIYRPDVGGVTAPRLVSKVDPAYPDTARKLRQQGVVILEAVITASGTVDQLRVVGSAGPLLDAAAVGAVRQWLYDPATLNKRTVAVFLTVTVRFALNG